MLGAAECGWHPRIAMNGLARVVEEARGPHTGRAVFGVQQAIGPATGAYADSPPGGWRLAEPWTLTQIGENATTLPVVARGASAVLMKNVGRSPDCVVAN